jgi:hypothetical protein
LARDAEGEAALTASDIVNHLGRAIVALCNNNVLAVGVYYIEVGDTVQQISLIPMYRSKISLNAKA